MGYNFCVAICRLLLLAHFLVPAMLQAQEVLYVDLTGVQQRTDLRHPPAPPPDCKAGVECGSSGWAGASILDGAPDSRDPRALTIQILSVVPDRIDPMEPVNVEFRVFNSGRVPLQLPVSPHLSDLQPPDESQSFRYMSLGLVVTVRIGDAQSPPNPDTPGIVELYGSEENARTMLVLSPGEWIRVRANVKLSLAPREAAPAWLKGNFWLRNNTFHPGAGGSSTEHINLYPNSGTAPLLPVQIVPARQ
jgi:hypothetical protein